MPRSRIKPLVALVAFAIAVALIAAAGLRDGWVYSLTVDEYVTRDTTATQRYRLTGVVGDDQLQVTRTGLSARFYLVGDDASLRVEYEGIIPDLFRAGHEVIVEGRSNEGGIFIADTLLTKCGSRYESEDSVAPHAERSFLDHESTSTGSSQ